MEVGETFVTFLLDVVNVDKATFERLFGAYFSELVFYCLMCCDGREKNRLTDEFKDTYKDTVHHGEEDKTSHREGRLLTYTFSHSWEQSKCDWPVRSQGWLLMTLLLFVCSAPIYFHSVLTHWPRFGNTYNIWCLPISICNEENSLETCI